MSESGTQACVREVVKTREDKPKTVYVLRFSSGVRELWMGSESEEEVLTGRWGGGFWDTYTRRKGNGGSVGGEGGLNRLWNPRVNTSLTLLYRRYPTVPSVT